MDDRILIIAIVVLGLVALLVPKLIGGLARARNHNELDDHRIGKTFLSEMTGPLPGDIGLIARIGANAPPRDSAGSKVLRTTVGLRMISVGISLAIVLVMGVGENAGMGLPATDSPLFMGLMVLLGLGVLDILSYELRVDQDGMVLTRFIIWRRRFDWIDLLGIDDDQNYQYVLAFRKGGRVKVLKHLVGIAEFLKVVMDAFARNDARNARTSRG